MQWHVVRMAAPVVLKENYPIDPIIQYENIHFIFDFRFSTLFVREEWGISEAFRLIPHNAIVFPNAIDV